MWYASFLGKMRLVTLVRHFSTLCARAYALSYFSFLLIAVSFNYTLAHAMSISFARNQQLSTLNRPTLPRLCPALVPLLSHLFSR